MVLLMSLFFFFFFFFFNDTATTEIYTLSLHDALPIYGTARNDNWWGYGEPLLAVADGEITAVVDGIPENTPRVLPSSFTLDNLAGNYIILRIGPQLYATYAHL